LTFSVATTVGLGATPGTLKVIVQLWEPVAMELAVLTEAVIVAGVAAGPLSASHAQSAPSEVSKFTPLEGLELETLMTWDPGAGPAVKYEPNESVAGAADRDGVCAFTVSVAVITAKGAGTLVTATRLSEMEQLCTPAVVRVAGATETTTLAGVTAGPVSDAHAQSAPSDVVKPMPLAGFVLLTTIVCEGGGLPPIT
jgi:hypothetical protein